MRQGQGGTITQAEKAQYHGEWGGEALRIWCWFHGVLRAVKERNPHSWP